MTKSLLRRTEARAYLGVSDWRFRRLLEAGRLVARRFHGRGRALYVVVELEALRCALQNGAGNVTTS